eukprot:UC4_evm4s590
MALNEGKKDLTTLDRSTLCWIMKSTAAIRRKRRNRRDDSNCNDNYHRSANSARTEGKINQQTLNLESFQPSSHSILSSVPDTTPGREDAIASLRSICMSGEATPNPTAMKVLKRACRASNLTLDAVFRSMMDDHLSKKHSQIRLAASQVAHELFIRSHHFRTLMCADLKAYLRYTVGLDDPLPAPKQHARVMRQEVLRNLHEWNIKFGPGYKQLSLAYNFLKDKQHINFSDIEAQLREEQQHERQLQAKQQRLRESRLRKVHEEFIGKESEIRTCVIEMISCFRLLVPGASNIMPQEQASSSTSPSPDEMLDILHEQGLGSMDFNIVVELNPNKKHEISSDVDNKSIMSALIDAAKLARVQYIPLLNSWIKTLAQDGGSQAENQGEIRREENTSLTSLINLRAEVQGVLDQYEKIKTIDRNINQCSEAD